MARYNLIRKMDISDGPGIRVSIFMQGCAFHCKNCFNKETCDFKLGHEFTDETINKVLDLCDNEVIKGLSILGGEPLHPLNIEASTKLASAFKWRFPNKDLWVWTGFLYDKNLENLKLPNKIESIGHNAFRETKIQNITIPNNVKKLSGCIFVYCGNLA